MKPIRVSILAAAIAVAGITVATAQTAAPAVPAEQAAPAASSAPGAASTDGRSPDCARELREGHSRFRRNANWLFGRADKDRDGQISRDELLAAQQRQLQLFDRADTNRDGKVSRDEMHAMREALREQRRQRGAPGTSSAPASEADLRG